MSVSAAQWGSLLGGGAAPSPFAEGVWGDGGVRLGDGDPATPEVMDHVGAPSDGDRVLCAIHAGKVYVIGKRKAVAR